MTKVAILFSRESPSFAFFPLLADVFAENRKKIKKSFYPSPLNSHLSLLCHQSTADFFLVFVCLSHSNDFEPLCCPSRALAKHPLAKPTSQPFNSFQHADKRRMTLSTSHYCDRGVQE